MLIDAAGCPLIYVFFLCPLFHYISTFSERQEFIRDFRHDVHAQWFRRQQRTFISNSKQRITHYAFLIDVDDRQTRNYFEVRYIPTWLEKEFLSIDFDYSFDNFGIRNATEDELTID